MRQKMKLFLGMWGIESDYQYSSILLMNVTIDTTNFGCDMNICRD